MLSKLFTFGFVWLTVTYYCSGMFMICTHSRQLFREIQSDISLFHNLHAIGAWHSSIQRLLPISDTRVWKVQLVNWPESTLTRRTWQKWRLYRTQLRFCSQFEVKREDREDFFGTCHCRDKSCFATNQMNPGASWKPTSFLNICRWINGHI